MGEYSGFQASSPTASRSARDQKRRQRSKAQEEEERETAVREGLVAKAAAMTKIAQNMAEQNETMLAGIQAAARYSNMGMDGEPLTAVDEKVDFVARNRVNVGVRFTSTACRCCVVACGKKGSFLTDCFAVTAETRPDRPPRARHDGEGGDHVRRHPAPHSGCAWRW